MGDLHCGIRQQSDCELKCPLLALPPLENVLFTSPNVWWREKVRISAGISYHIEPLCPKRTSVYRDPFSFACAGRVTHKWSAHTAFPHWCQGRQGPKFLSGISGNFYPENHLKQSPHLQRMGPRVQRGIHMQTLIKKYRKQSRTVVRVKKQSEVQTNPNHKTRRHGRKSLNQATMEQKAW